MKVSVVDHRAAKDHVREFTTPFAGLMEERTVSIVCKIRQNGQNIFGCFKNISTATNLLTYLLTYLPPISDFEV